MGEAVSEVAVAAADAVGAGGHGTTAGPTEHAAAAAVAEGGPSLLLVDDDAPLRRSLQRAMERRGFRVLAVDSLQAGLDLAHTVRPEYAVVDLRLEDGSGLDLVRRLRELHPRVRVVILTGYGNIATAVAAVKAGAVDYLAKPADADEVINALLATGAGLPPPPSNPMSADRCAGSTSSGCSSSAAATSPRPPPPQHAPQDLAADPEQARAARVVTTATGGRRACRRKRRRSQHQQQRQPIPAGRRLLLVDDDAPLRKNLVRAFEREGFEVGTAGSLKEAYEVAGEFGPDFAVST
jgi:two-component system response regulator RegA